MHSTETEQALMDDPKLPFHWLNVERIAEELADAHPDIDPMTITFPRLKELVEALPNFKEQSGHPCNERILETIQAMWIEAEGESREGD